MERFLFFYSIVAVDGTLLHNRFRSDSNYEEQRIRG